MKSSEPDAAMISRPVQPLQKRDGYEEYIWRDSDSDDGCDCVWPDGNLTSRDRQLWESLLERNHNSQVWLSYMSNRNNDRCVEATSEELIPRSAATPEITTAQWAQQKDGASRRCQLTLERARGNFGVGCGGSGGTRTNSVSTTPRPVRVVNSAAEACDRRWCQLACDPSQCPPRVQTAAPSEVVPQGSLRKAGLLTKRLPQSDLVADDPRPCRTLPPSTDLQNLWHTRLRDVKNVADVASASLDGSALQRIPSSDVPWLLAQSRGFQLPLGTSEVTMEISGESLSSDLEEAVAAEPLPVADAIRMADNDRLSLGLSSEWRNVVSISVIGQSASTAKATHVGSAATALAPLPIMNTRTTSTNTEQSFSTTVAGTSEYPSALEARAVLLARFAMNSDDTIAFNGSHKRPPSQPKLVHQGKTQQPLLLRRPARSHTARILLRRGAVSQAPVWLVCGSQPSPEGASVASLQQCLADNARFAWHTWQPAVCSRISCQRLSGLVDVSLSSENELVLPRLPVYVHRRQSTGGNAVTTVDGQATMHSVVVTAPQILSALRFVLPSDTADWLPPEVSSSPDAVDLSPVASLWSQKVRWMPQPTIDIGLQFQTGSVPPGSIPPALPQVFQAASSGSEGGNLVTSAEEPPARPTRKNEQLQQLRRIVRMKMRQRVLGDEFVGVACCCCSCCSSPMNAEAVVESSVPDDPPDKGGNSNSDLLERSLGGLLETLRNCRQTASVVAKVQRQRRCTSGDRQLVNFVERILHESTSQQAALTDLLASLNGTTPPPQQDEAKEIDMEDASTRSNFSCSQSDLFYSMQTGTTGLPDDGTMATGHRTDLFASPEGTTSAICGFGENITANNNARDTVAAARWDTPSPTSSDGPGQHRRHRTHYALGSIVRLEESAAPLVHDTVSLVTTYSWHQDWSDGGNFWGGSSNSSASTVIVQQATACRQSRRRLYTRVLARAWRNQPPITQRQLDKLDPTVASFIWWSLIPRNRRIQLSPDVVTEENTNSRDSPVLPLQHEVEIAIGNQPTANSAVSEAAALSSFTDQSVSCELELERTLRIPIRRTYS